MKEGLVSEGMATAVYTSGVGFLSSTEEILDDMRNGRMVVLVDAEDRENEGDLIIPAQMATPDAINFMAKNGRGLICLSLTQTRAETLHLESMVRSNSSRTGTAFTVSIEAREGITTGISAHDRARTIATAIDPTKGQPDIVSPGHVFPLIARDGGVLVRAGHTEASVDLCRLAGLYPAAVICEIMNDDGTMARIPDLVPFAQRHGLKIGTIEDLIAYRFRNDNLVNLVTQRKVASVHGGEFDLRVYGTNVEPGEHLAMIKGDLSAPGPVLVRVHAVKPLSDLLGIKGEVDRSGHIRKSLQAIDQEGRGVLVLVRDLRLKAIMDALGLESPGTLQRRAMGGRRMVEVGIGSQILRHLGVRDMILLTNAPAPVYVGLEGFGLRVVGTRRID